MFLGLCRKKAVLIHSNYWIWKIVDEGVKPAVERVYTIKNTIDYY
ncbi:YnfC family lipoprotein [Shigella flexneri]